MRTISAKVIYEFLQGRKRALSNTSTDGQTLWLHGNPIACKRLDGSILVSACGWYTPTTKERLNALFQLRGVNGHIWQAKGKWYVKINGVTTPWDQWSRVI